MQKVKMSLSLVVEIQVPTVWQLHYVKIVKVSFNLVNIQNCQCTYT